MFCSHSQDYNNSLASRRAGRSAKSKAMLYSFAKFKDVFDDWTVDETRVVNPNDGKWQAAAEVAQRVFFKTKELEGEFILSPYGQLDTDVVFIHVYRRRQDGVSNLFRVRLCQDGRGADLVPVRCSWIRRHERQRGAQRPRGCPDASARRRQAVSFFVSSYAYGQLD